MKILYEQYLSVQNSRKVLLHYCESLSNQDFTKEFEHFGRGSIRNLLVHICNTYQFWIGKFSLKQDILFAKALDIQDITQVKELFTQVNDLIKIFLQEFENQLDKPIVEQNFAGDKTLEIPPLTLFTHVITHEFHHKGQILSMGRHIGYIPPDTDVIR